MAQNLPSLWAGKGGTMMMFLMVLCMATFALALMAIAFGAATRDESRQTEIRAADAPSLGASRFFVSDTARPPVATRVPIEVLLLQLERHVRLEQAAAEAFLDYPTTEALHSRTTSPLVH
jgi:hypothetical protein